MDRAQAHLDLVVRPAPPASRAPPRPAAPSCVRPQDLYATPGREAIGRLLAGWLQRHRATPFELLHRADLAAKLESCEAELSAVLYNAALIDAAAQGAPLEPIRRALDALARRTIERIMADDPAIGFRLGVAVAGRLGRHAHWRDKLEALLELIDAAPTSGAPAAMALRVLQQPMIDILGAQGELDEILGDSLALGDQLLILVQIASAPAIAAVLADDADLGRTVPHLHGLPARLAVVLHGRASFVRTRRAIIRRVLTILAGEAWLWPRDPAREVQGLKALAALLAVSGRLADQEQVAAAFASRWRRLSGPDFVDARLALCEGALEEADVMLDLVDAAVGRAPAEALGRRLLSILADQGFEQEARFSSDPPSVSLNRLAVLAGRVRAGALRADVGDLAEQRLRRLAAVIEAEAVTFHA